MTLQSFDEGLPGLRRLEIGIMTDSRQETSEAFRNSAHTFVSPRSKRIAEYYSTIRKCTSQMHCYAKANAVGDARKICLSLADNPLGPTAELRRR